MVSLWPFKSADESPASFEKALASLSERISKGSSKVDGLRSQSRRLTGLWTLYSIFLYLLYTVILVLVVGWRNWGLGEYGAVIGGPLLIYGVRYILLSFYQYRISGAQRQLDDLQKQRDTTIKKLKKATKYDTTQELLKKYGGEPTSKPKAKPSSQPDRNATPKQEGSRVPSGGRTSFVPPPTANIPGRSPPEMTNQLTPQQQTPRRQASQTPSSPNSPIQASPGGEDSNAEFAPNAFAAYTQYAPATDSTGPRWYDRVMDLLMGEDETLPGKRLALICNNCRLVNGQAPPGTQRLEDVGRWRCAACRSMNGEEKGSEVRKIVAGIKREQQEESGEVDNVLDKGLPSKKAVAERKEDENRGVAAEEAGDGEDSDVTQYSTNDDEADGGGEMVEVSHKKEESADGPRRRSKRTRASPKKAR